MPQTAKCVLPELIVSEKMSILQKNPDFCHQHYKKIIQINCHLSSKTLLNPVSRISHRT